MDLSLLQDSFSDFATFGKNVGIVFKNIPELLLDVLGFFDNFGDNTETTGNNFEAISN